jgi:hypothetical protein
LLAREFPKIEKKHISSLFIISKISPLPWWERIHPVKYELFDVTHLKSMQQDAAHGYLSLLLNRVKVRGI